MCSQTVSDFEVFIVGDGMDETTRAVANHVASLDPRFRVFDMPKEPKRNARNRHEALLSAQSEYVAYVDDDDFWFPDHLAALEAALENADFVHTRLFMLHVHYMFEVFHDTLENPDIREKMLTQPFNFFGPSQAGHRLSTYMALPEGWAPPVDDMRGTISTCGANSFPRRAFASAPVARSPRFSVPSSVRPGWPLHQRHGELTFWTSLLTKPGVQQRINSIFDQSQTPDVPILASGHTSTHGWFGRSTFWKNSITRNR